MSPNFTEIPSIWIVLGDGDRVIKIKDTVPPIAWDKDCLTRFLNEFISFFNQACLQNSRIDEVEKVNCFIVLSFILKVLPFCYFEMDIFWKTNPVLMTLKTCVPGRGWEGVFVHGCAGSLRADKEPSERGSAFVPKKFEIIVLKIFWNFVVLDKVFNTSRGFLDVWFKQI